MSFNDTNKMSTLDILWLYKNIHEINETTDIETILNNVIIDDFSIGMLIYEDICKMVLKIYGNTDDDYFFEEMSFLNEFRISKEIYDNTKEMNSNIIIENTVNLNKLQNTTNPISSRNNNSFIINNIYTLCKPIIDICLKQVLDLFVYIYKYNKDFKNIDLLILKYNEKDDILIDLHLLKLKFFIKNKESMFISSRNINNEIKNTTNSVEGNNNEIESINNKTKNNKFNVENTNINSDNTILNTLNEKIISTSTSDKTNAIPEQKYDKKNSSNLTYDKTILRNLILNYKGDLNFLLESICSFLKYEKDDLLITKLKFYSESGYRHIIYKYIDSTVYSYIKDTLPMCTELLIKGVYDLDEYLNWSLSSFKNLSIVRINDLVEVSKLFVTYLQNVCLLCSGDVVDKRNEFYTDVINKKKNFKNINLSNEKKIISFCDKDNSSYASTINTESNINTISVLNSKSTINNSNIDTKNLVTPSHKKDCMNKILLILKNLINCKILSVETRIKTIILEQIEQIYSSILLVCGNYEISYINEHESNISEEYVNVKEDLSHTKSNFHISNANINSSNSEINCIYNKLNSSDAINNKIKSPYIINDLSKFILESSKNTILRKIIAKKIHILRYLTDEHKQLCINNLLNNFDLDWRYRKDLIIGFYKCDLIKHYIDKFKNDKVWYIRNMIERIEKEIMVEKKNVCDNMSCIESGGINNDNENINKFNECDIHSKTIIEIDNIPDNTIPTNNIVNNTMITNITSNNEILINTTPTNGTLTKLTPINTAPTAFTFANTTSNNDASLLNLDVAKDEKNIKFETFSDSCKIDIQQEQLENQSKMSSEEKDTIKDKSVDFHSDTVINSYTTNNLLPFVDNKMLEKNKPFESRNQDLQTIEDKFVNLCIESKNNDIVNDSKYIENDNIINNSNYIESKNSSKDINNKNINNCENDSNYKCKNKNNIKNENNIYDKTINKSFNKDNIQTRNNKPINNTFNNLKNTSNIVNENINNKIKQDNFETHTGNVKDKIKKFELKLNKKTKPENEEDKIVFVNENKI